MFCFLEQHTCVLLFLLMQEMKAVTRRMNNTPPRMGIRPLRPILSVEWTLSSRTLMCPVEELAPQAGLNLTDESLIFSCGWINQWQIPGSDSSLVFIHQLQKELSVFAWVFACWVEFGGDWLVDDVRFIILYNWSINVFPSQYSFLSQVNLLHCISLTKMHLRLYV